MELLMDYWLTKRNLLRNGKNGLINFSIELFYNDKNLKKFKEIKV